MFYNRSKINTNTLTFLLLAYDNTELMGLKQDKKRSVRSSSIGKDAQNRDNSVLNRTL